LCVSSVIFLKQEGRPLRDGRKRRGVPQSDLKTSVLGDVLPNLSLGRVHSDTSGTVSTLVPQMFQYRSIPFG
ncbi:hypothetical protein BaRGS_00004197, partial [Batillaria attramentaria]